MLFRSRADAHLGTGRLLLAGALVALVLGTIAWVEVLAGGDELLSPGYAWTGAAVRLFVGAILVTAATSVGTIVTLWLALRPVDVEAAGHAGQPASSPAGPDAEAMGGTEP